jgi:diguanylate cyclase (GGDEF)-like protein
MGDEVLRRFSYIIRKTSRVIDIPASLGGEEFAILLPNTTQNEAMTIAERLRKQVADIAIPHEKGLVSVTISIGGVALSMDEVDNDVVLSRADTALYEAKDAGRNQCRWFAGI